ncbi:MAG: hypothetical protein BAJALOKI3v1_1070012 [Promethearchaeota archaeon]|jgi:hypothetical protein|nr:MAG: hypothetical protein BAJALOKI3v1_1070012 [Candidatus Lokiarchaeota archaeon]
MKKTPSSEQDLVEKYLEKLKLLESQEKLSSLNQKYKYKIIDQLTQLLFKYKDSKEMYVSITNLINLFLNFHGGAYPIDIFSLEEKDGKLTKDEYRKILMKEVSRGK